jgi:arginyl-tRNA synthetase
LVSDSHRHLDARSRSINTGSVAAHSDPIVVLGEIVASATVEALGAEFAGVDPAVRRSDRADFQADLAMGLARRAKRPPRAIAEAIALKIAIGDVVEKVEVAGPGFINLTLTASWIADAVERIAADERLGVPTADKPERVVIDYSHPNVAKEMHVGHLRSTVIGDALARLFTFRGHTVIRQNHLGDWGTPFGMLIEHLLDLGEEEAAQELLLGQLVVFYKAARKKFETDAAFADRSRARVVALQSGDAETLKWWRRLVELSTRYFEEVYRALDITLTPADVRGESFYNPLLAPLADELEKSGAARMSDGALCLFPPGFKNKEDQPLPLIVRKSDGGFGYATTDLAAIRYRLKDLGATRILYIVGAPQTQHFAMIFAAAKELGWLLPPARAEHAPFGSVLGPDGKMFATRAGDTVRLVDLIDEAIARAEEKIREKATDLDAATAKEVARMVGVGALKYADLSSDRVKDYVFDVDRMVSFDGNSAGYAQYAYARIRSIFRKAEGSPLGAIRIGETTERRLALELLGFAAVITKVEETLQPHHLAGFVHGLATSFTAFQDQCRIVKGEDGLPVPDEVRGPRLALADVTARTLARALDLLGIAVPDRM